MLNTPYVCLISSALLEVHAKFMIISYSATPRNIALCASFQYTILGIVVYDLA